jgi:hypothetical protein
VEPSLAVPGVRTRKFEHCLLNFEETVAVLICRGGHTGRRLTRRLDRHTVAPRGPVPAHVPAARAHHPHITSPSRTAAQHSAHSTSQHRRTARTARQHNTHNTARTTQHAQHPQRVHDLTVHKRNTIVSAQANRAQGIAPYARAPSNRARTIRALARPGARAVERRASSVGAGATVRRRRWRQASGVRRQAGRGKADR